jgi:hypothetical protein
MGEVQQRVEYQFPGVLFAETSSKRVTMRDPLEAVVMAPDESFAFRFYEVTEAPDLGKEFNVTSVPRNFSGWHYIDAQIFTLEDVDAMGDDFHILASNMRCNGWDRVVRCRTGNFQPFETSDTIVSGR